MPVRILSPTVNKNRETYLTLLLPIFAIIACTAISELGIRLFFKDDFALHQDERNLTYRHDPSLGWFPIENSLKQFTGSRTISVRHNSQGFRGAEHVLDERPRMIVLGDSFVWGYDAEQNERFTEKLQTKMPEWAIYNMGVSGYGTDQEYLLLKEKHDVYQPNIVLLIYCTDNDHIDNTNNRRYDGYFKPYFTIDDEQLILNGTPAPISENHFFSRNKFLSQSYLARLLAKKYFKLVNPTSVTVPDPTYRLLEEINKFTRQNGSELVVGLQDDHEKLESFLKDSNIPYVVLRTPHRYPTNGSHWTPEGHTVVSERIYKLLSDIKILSNIKDGAKNYD